MLAHCCFYITCQGSI